MYIDHGPEVKAEQQRRKALGLPTLRWYKCHACGWEHEYCAMVGKCGNCGAHLNIHSDLDGEQPNFVKVAT